MMNKENTGGMVANINKKRLGIYLVLAFLLVWIPTILYLVRGGEYKSGAMQFILAYSMLCPAMAVLITRKLTGEGLAFFGENSMMLGVQLSGKRWIWYMVALLLPFVYYELGDLIYFIFFPEAFGTATIEELGFSAGAVLSYPVMGIVSGAMISFGGLGEELGWRGYMFPKLEKLMGTGKALWTGGIIWGVWHFPAIAAGHNFGTGYFGEPWSAFIMFTISTISLGVILTYLTKKTDSVWPAAFLHAINNTGARISALFYLEEVSGLAANSLVLAGIHNLPIMVIAILCYVRMRKEGLVKMPEKL